MRNVTKTMKVTPKTHKDLRMFIAEKEIDSLGEGIDYLLKQQQAKN